MKNYFIVVSERDSHIEQIVTATPTQDIPTKYVSRVEVHYTNGFVYNTDMSIFTEEKLGLKFIINDETRWFYKDVECVKIFINVRKIKEDADKIVLDYINS